MTQIVGNKEWDGVSPSRRIGAITAIGFGVSLSVLNGNITNVALPSFTHIFGVTAADTIWIVNAFQLTVVMLLLSFSSLADRVGYRKVYLSGVTLFTLASLGCALSGSFSWLIFWRVMQGIGAAAIMSINTSIVRTIFPKNRLARGLGINAAIVSVAAVSGPTIAAGILAFASWHWLFAVNVPIGLIALTLGYYYIPDNPLKIKGEKFNWADSIMNALTFGLFLSMIEGYSHGWSLGVVFGGIAATIVVGYFYVKSQLHREYPLLPFDLLRIPIFTLSIITSICSFIATTAALTAIPFFFQHSLGISAVHTGLLITAWPIVMGIVAPMAGYLTEKIHPGILGLAGLAISAFGMFMVALTPHDASVPNIVWRLMTCSLGIGLFQAPNNSIMIGSAPTQRSGSASGMQATARLIGQTTGAAFVALSFTLFGTNGAVTAICIGGSFALIGAILSSTRIGLKLPETLRSGRKK